MSDTGNTPELPPQMPDMGSLLEQAQALGAQMFEQQAEAENTIVEGVSGGGAVTITMTGTGDFQEVKIAPSAVDPDDVEMLEDLVLAALKDCQTQIAELAPDMDGLNLGGLDLGGLFGGAS